MSRTRPAGRLGAVLVTTLTVAALGACGGGQPEPAGAAPAERPRITLVQGVATDEFYITLACGAEARAAELGVDLDVQGPPTFDPAAQTPIVTAAIAGAPDAIVIAPTDSEALAGPLRQAREAGIEVVLVDTALTDQGIAASSISSDNVEGGRAAARTIAELMGEQGKVVAIGGTPGATTVEQRLDGFAEQIATYPGITYLGNQPTPTGGVQQAASVTASSLSRDPDIAGVFAISTPAGEGANNAIRDAGLAGRVSVVGFDAGPAQVEQLESGLVQALIAQRAGDIGAQGVEQALRAVRGEPVEASIRTDFVPLTAENIADPANAAYVYSSSCG